MRATRIVVMLVTAAVESQGFPRGSHQHHPYVPTWSARPNHALVAERLSGCPPKQLASPRHLLPEAAAAAALSYGVYCYTQSAEEQKRKAEWAEYEARREAEREERRKAAYIEPRDEWREEELAEWRGEDFTGPLLVAVDGLVFNAWQGRHFYGPGCEYHIMAGRDATRLLAKQKLEEETEAERAAPLTLAERATLAGWVLTFKSKYEIVGKLKGHDPSDTSIEALEGLGKTVESLANARPW